MKTKEEYINYKLRKAGEALKEAETPVANNFYEAAVSRLYYSAFYAVNALLINMDLNPKTHKGAKSLFQKEFIHTGKIDKKFSDFYTFMMAKRFEMDYEDFSYVDKEKVPDYFQEANEFLELVKQKLNLKQ